MMLNLQQIQEIVSLEESILLGILFLAMLFFALKMVTHQKAYKRERKIRKELQKRNFELQTTIEQEQKYQQEKLDFLHMARSEMADHFSSLAQDIIDSKGQKLSSLQQEKMSAILQPFQEQLASFKTDVSTIHIDNTKERTTLKQEIIHLKELNQKISEEATNLTQALKGDKKIQGSWGELILEKILEQSGLRNGHEYSTQKSLRDKDNQLFRPDAIIHLPDDKDVIIDSKVSLISWERYINSSDETDKQKHIKGHIQAIKQHITSLASKDYSKLKGVNSPEFIFLFMPIEPAYTTAFQEKPEIFTVAFKHNIVIVTPTTLLTAIRIVETLWSKEKQDKNALEIAERAAILYDKFRGFIEDMEKLGNQLSTCANSYDNAINKLCTGKGNLVSQSEKLTELGVRVKKKIPNQFLDKDKLSNLPN